MPDLILIILTIILFKNSSLPRYFPNVNLTNSWLSILAVRMEMNCSCVLVLVVIIYDVDQLQHIPCICGTYNLLVSKVRRPQICKLYLRYRSDAPYGLTHFTPASVASDLYLSFRSEESFCVPYPTITCRDTSNHLTFNRSCWILNYKMVRKIHTTLNQSTERSPSSKLMKSLEWPTW